MKKENKIENNNINNVATVGADITDVSATEEEKKEETVATVGENITDVSATEKRKKENKKKTIIKICDCIIIAFMIVFVIFVCVSLFKSCNIAKACELNSEISENDFDEFAEFNCAFASSDSGASSFVVGQSYDRIYFDFTVDNSVIESELSSFINGESFIFMNYNSFSSVSIFWASDYNGHDYVLKLSSNTFNDFIWDSDNGWYITAPFVFDGFYSCISSVNLSFISPSFNWGNGTVLGDNGFGLTIGDTAKSLIVDSSFVNAFYFEEEFTSDYLAYFTDGGTSSFYYLYLDNVRLGYNYVLNFKLDYVYNYQGLPEIITSYTLCSSIGSVGTNSSVLSFDYADFDELNLIYRGWTDEFYSAFVDEKSCIYDFIAHLKMGEYNPAVVDELNSEIVSLNNWLDRLIRDYDDLEASFNEIVSSSGAWAGATGWIASMFRAVGDLLNIELFNGITIGVVLCIPLIVGIIMLILKIARG